MKTHHHHFIHNFVHNRYIEQIKEHPNFTSEVILPVCLTVVMMVGCWRIFSLSTVLLSNTFYSMYKQYSKYYPADWPILRMIFLSLALVFLSWVADKSLVGGIILNILVVFYLAFYFTNSKTDTSYSQYITLFIITESMNVPLSFVFIRCLCILYCCLCVIIFLILNNMVMRHSWIPDFDIRTVFPYRQFKKRYRSFKESNVRLLKSFHHIVVYPFHKKHHYFKDSRNFHFHKTRFALRLALLVSLCFAAARIMNSPMTTLLPLLVFLMVKPYYTAALPKMKSLVLGNISAVILSSVLLAVFETPFDYMAIILILIIGRNFYPSNFQDTLCSVTLSMVVSSVTMDNTALLTFRTLYVVLAVLIAFLGNLYLYPNRKELNV